MVDSHAPGSKEPIETRAIRELIDPEDVGHVSGSNNKATVEPFPRRTPQRRTTANCQHWFPEQD